MNYVLGAIPLSRPAVVDFLTARSTPPQGPLVATIGQRPSAMARRAWFDRLRAAINADDVSVDLLLANDDPHAHLIQTPTDRLIPAGFIDEPEFLTRTLGGWAPVLFDVFGHDGTADDPLLEQLEVLVEYGPIIAAVTADPVMVSERLDDEVGGGVMGAARVLTDVADLVQGAGDAMSAVTALTRALHDEVHPQAVLFDALLDILVTIETRRRQFVADGDTTGAEVAAELQGLWREDGGFTLILKGEYIAGRHRRSTVLIAPDFGVVVKQPAPEPLHQITTRVIYGVSENWPQPVDGGALVTPRGRLRMMLEDGAMPQLTAALTYDITFCSLLGVTVEPHIAGATLQQAALQDPESLTQDVYESIVMHQQVCELFGIDNADWHAANFMVARSLVHVDWGAARTLRPEEQTPHDAQRRLDQVRNLAFSFHDEALAQRVHQLHSHVTEDPDVMGRIRARAKDVVA